MKKNVSRIYEHLILPVINSVAPIRQVSWGVAIGTFIGLTPTMGIQMYIVMAVWGICRLFRFRFNLPVGVAIVWISNPITVIPLYFIFLLIGNIFFQFMQWSTVNLDWRTFQQKFEEIEQLSFWEEMQEALRFLLVELGLPMVVGSLFLAVPLAIGAYFATRILLVRYRKYKASQANLTYEEWCMRYETSN